MVDKCVGHRRQCACPKCTEFIQYLADDAAKRLANRTHWMHVITHDHRHGLRTERVTADDQLTPEEAIQSRARRLCDTPTDRGWSRDGMTLHIRDRHEERWITYQGPDAHAEEWRTVTLLDEQTA